MNAAGNPGSIAVDLMGADRGPAEVVAGVKQALDRVPGAGSLVLVGRPEEVEPILKTEGLDRDERVTLLPASEVVDMHDKPVQAMKQKKDSSMMRAIGLVKEGECAAVLSCGNTGALMAAGTVLLRPMSGVERPALAAVMPRRNGYFVMLDVGANPTSKPEHLVHNAILGSHYCRVVLGKEKPTVGLLTIGTEEGKGTELIHDTHAHLKRIGDIVNYAGPVEGFQVFDDSGTDVIVCDGFVGNVLLKTCESLAKMFKSLVKEEVTANPIRTVGAMLCSGGFKAVREKTSQERYGGAPLLGLKGNVLKAHGSSNRDAIMHAIRIASEVVRYDLREHARPDLAAANAIMRPESASTVVEEATTSAGA